MPTGDELREVLRERRVAEAALAATLRRTRTIANSYTVPDKAALGFALLLRMSEGLICAHKAAKIDDDGYTLDLIEEAMRHVGKRLAKETDDGRNLCQRRHNPHR